MTQAPLSSPRIERPLDSDILAALAELTHAMQRVRLSATSSKIYLGWTRRYLRWCRGEQHMLDESNLPGFVHSLKTSVASVASQRQGLAALSFYFLSVCKTDVSAIAAQLRPDREPAPPALPGGLKTPKRRRGKNLKAAARPSAAPPQRLGGAAEPNASLPLAGG